jgi:hypothetical protein
MLLLGFGLVGLMELRRKFKPKFPHYVVDN